MAAPTRPVSPAVSCRSSTSSTSETSDDDTSGGGGFVVTRLIRGAPGDTCGLLVPGDTLVSVDGRPIGALSFGEVSALLAGQANGNTGRKVSSG